MSRSLGLALTSLVLGFAGVSGAGIAIAQTADTVNNSTTADEGLGEIVVTAQRHEESAQRAAIAISTLAGGDITQSNVTRPEGLTDLVPALQATDDTGPYSIFYVRGVGNFAANALSDPALLFNFDGVAVSRAGTSGFFYDLERVEVLKGPQGILYGRNATGGAVNVISKTPVLGTFSGDASIQYGNYSASREDVALNMPVGETSAVRLAAFHVQHSGYMEDGTESQADTGARLSVLTIQSDSLQVKLVADYFHQGGDQAGGTVTGITNSFTTAPSFTPSDRLGFFSPQVQAYLQTQTDFLNGAKFLPFQNLNAENNRFYGIATTLDWKTPVGTLTVVPAYRDSQLDYTSFATGVMLSEISYEKQTSVEVRLASDTDQPLRYIVGAYYFDDPEDVPKYDINQQANATFSQYDTDSISKALFGNLTYAVTPELRLAGGVRYTKDDKELVGGPQANAIICTVKTAFGPYCPQAGVLPYSLTSVGPPVYFNPNGTITTLSIINDNQGATYDKVTWRFGADWDVTDHNLLYGSVETGFKSGGFFFSSDYDVYRPETITAYTIGSKNRFLNDRLQANLELFYWRYHDQQISHLGTDSAHDTIFATQNVGQSTIKGFELELKARPLPNTLLSADFQYNDAVYDSFVYQTPNDNGGISNGTGCPSESVSSTAYTVNCSGKQPPYAPRWSIAAGLQETAPMPGSSTLVGSARVHYQSTTLTALDFLPVEEQSGYAKWDFDLTYYVRDDRYYVSAYVDNAFNKTALAFSFVTPFSSFLTSTLQPPRTYGVRVGAHF
jgi:iron complex outermembrane recepter protein